MSEPFIHSGHCQAWVFCEECRNSRAFRESLFWQNAVGEVDFACPYGFQEDRFPEKPKDAVLAVVNEVPIYDLPKLWGPRRWEMLHLRALTWKGKEDSEWLKDFCALTPCEECRGHLTRVIQEIPPVWEEYFRWTVDCHNAVNRVLQKAEMPHAQARDLWQAKL